MEELINGIPASRYASPEVADFMRRAWAMVDDQYPTRTEDDVVEIDRGPEGWTGEPVVKVTRGVRALPKRRGGNGSNTPVSPEVAARKARALKYVTEYTGSWGLILDIRADRAWGTSHFRMSDRLVEVLNNAADRDAARAATNAVDAAATQPRLAEALAWITGNPTNDFARSLAQAHKQWGRLTDRQYEAVIRNVDRSAPVAPKADGTAPVARASQDGWYLVGETVYKVQKAVHGSGNLYAKRLVVTGHGEASWEYAPGVIRTLTDDQRMSVEAAAKFGQLYGVCAVCGRTLTDESSIANGIGPVCIRKISR